MDPLVRLAIASDESELHRLQSIARAALVGVRGGDLRLLECPVIDDWAALAADPDARVLLGVIDDVPISYMVLRFAVDRDRGIVTHAFVEADARELGFGDAMLEVAIAACRARGLTGIEAVALPGDRDTKNMYERAGMTARKLTVYKSLSDQV